MPAGPVLEGATPEATTAEQPLFVYGVLPVGPAGAAPATEGLTGIDGEPVQLVLCGDLAAAVSPVELERPPGRRADLLGYQAVLDALAASGPVAPVRFGSVMPDPDTVVDELLLPNAERFASLLDTLSGRRQFTLRAVAVEDAVLADLVATNDEIRMLRERTRDLPEDASYRERMRLGELVARGLEEHSTHFADLLLDSVVPLSASHQVRTPPSATQVLDVALLVDDERADDLVDTLEELAEALHDRLSLTLLGPLPAYDFVGETSWV